tara:strand:+ start:5334 stop:6098 length:765 start_codon:yes stop_codon:yes gene_type:complete
MGFKMRKGKNTSFKDLGSSPKKQLDIANLQENPSDIYSGEVLGEEGWEQQFNQASETQVPIRDKYFDRNKRDKLTRRGRKEREEYISMIEKRRQDPRIKDLKKDRSQSQLTRGMIERGFSQVQDPYGNWHAMDRRGRLTGSRFNYSPESKAWRDKMSLAPGQTSHVGDKIEKGTELTIKYPKTQKQNITRQTKTQTTKKTGKTFDQAFAEARKAGKKTFDWAGKKTGGEKRSFNTMLKGEKKEDWLKNIVKKNN